ncbi:MAG: (2Fe-2S)-binding protein [Hyphomicrobiaceae bacterium]
MSGDGASVSHNILLNGRPTEITVPAGTSFLEALRHDGHSLGTRVGCAEGHCGACTVLVDGHAVQACTTPVAAVAGAAVTTVEGHGGHTVLAQVRAAFLAEQAAQCAYCINGILMTVAGMLARTPAATRGEIVAALDERHRCRCGAHARILRAIDRAIRPAGGQP